MQTPTLQITDFSLSYGPVQALANINMEIARGRIMGVVGESGSGKSTLARATLGLLPSIARTTSGVILFEGTDLTRLNAAQLRQIRGAKITYISQDPLRALTPTLTIGALMTDIQYRSGESRREKRRKAIETLERVGLPNPEQRLNMYPHEMSGGQRQRISIAMAVMMKPALLIADEATTALDATLELEIIRLLKELQSEIGCSMMFVTHHLGVVASLCDDVTVLRHGVVCEQGTVREVFGNPQNQYTKTLLRCDPALIEKKTRRLPTTSDDPDAPIVVETGPPDRIKTHKAPIIQIKDLDVTFRKKAFLGGLLGGDGYEIKAVKKASLSIHEGETVAVVGESGSGKTTLARAIIGLQATGGGTIRFNDQDLTQLTHSQYRPVRKDIAIMFQDPIGALSPRMRVCDVVTEPLRIHSIPKDDYRAEARHLLGLVGLDETFLDRYPHEMSGGQARRVSLARAIALEPKMIVADEPTAGLDVSIQGEILNLIAEIQDRTGVSILLITHNLNVVRHISDRVAIMYMGEFLEIGKTENIFENPQHAYTRKLIAANHHPSF
jgi:ABC-type glutathione transport system ATPase component